MSRWFTGRGTCHATCSVLVTTGGGILFLVPLGLFLAALINAMHLVIDEVLLVFLVHSEDVGLPFGVAGRYPHTNVCDEGSVAG